MNWYQSHINHKVREHLGLTTDQYMVAEIVYHYSAKFGGWCELTKAEISKAIGVSSKTVQRAFSELESLKIIERNSANQMRTLPIWFELVIEGTGILEGDKMATQRDKLSSPLGQNGHPPQDKLSSLLYKVETNSIIDILEQGHFFVDRKKVPPDDLSVQNYFAFLWLESSKNDPTLTLEESEKQAQKFINYHTANAWKMKGGRGALMKDWQAASRTWWVNYLDDYRKTPKANLNTNTLFQNQWK